MNKKLAFVMKPGRNALLLLAAAGFAAGCHKTINPDQKDLRNFEVENLVANKAIYHPEAPLDPTLINGFGVAWSPNGIAWVNSVGGHVSELYHPDGSIARTPVNIPTSAIDTTNITAGLPCGIVFSAGKGFTLPNGNKSIFIFTGFDGVLSAWSGGSNAVFLRQPTGARYTGLAIGNDGNRNLIYGANFKQKRIDVWDTSFARVNMSFSDPSVPAQYSPYNIQAVGDWLFVVYGVLDVTPGSPNQDHGVKGEGLGYVSVFDMRGKFQKSFASRGTLNLPWGVTAAPASFLENKDIDTEGHSNLKQANYNPKDPVMLIGNFGDGRINVFNQDGKYIGQLAKSNKQPISIDGLWSLTFAPTGLGLDDKLWFSAGPANESDGIFGYLEKK